MKASDLIIALDENNFALEVDEERGRIVLIDFWAPWCSPCNVIKMLLLEVAEEYQAKLKICSINIESASTLADRFEIRGVPYLLLFKDGKVLHKLVGLISKAQLIEIIDETTSLI